MLDPVGFCSYARQDDRLADGQLSQLRAMVGKAVNLRQGEEITLWQDIAAIPFGADWAATIERTIGQVTFFVPIVTPRYLKSENCFAEFKAFGERMRALGRDDLIFPIYYVDVDNIQPGETAFGSELTALRRHQWIDFRPLQFEDAKSPRVRQWADQLAASILSAMRRKARGQARAEPRRTVEAEAARPAPQAKTSVEPAASRPEAEQPQSNEAATAAAKPDAAKLDREGGRGREKSAPLFNFPYVIATGSTAKRVVGKWLVGAALLYLIFFVGVFIVSDADIHRVFREVSGLDLTGSILLNGLMVSVGLVIAVSKANNMITVAKSITVIIVIDGLFVALLDYLEPEVHVFASLITTLIVTLLAYIVSIAMFYFFDRRNNRQRRLS